MRQLNNSLAQAFIDAQIEEAYNVPEKTVLYFVFGETKDSGTLRQIHHLLKSNCFFSERIRDFQYYIEYFSITEIDEYYKTASIQKTALQSKFAAKLEERLKIKPTTPIKYTVSEVENDNNEQVNVLKDHEESIINNVCRTRKERKLIEDYFELGDGDEKDSLVAAIFNEINPYMLHIAYFNLRNFESAQQSIGCIQNFLSSNTGYLSVFNDPILTIRSYTSKLDVPKMPAVTDREKKTKILEIEEIFSPYLKRDFGKNIKYWSYQTKEKTQNALGGSMNITKAEEILSSTHPLLRKVAIIFILKVGDHFKVPFSIYLMTMINDSDINDTADFFNLSQAVIELLLHVVKSSLPKYLKETFADLYSVSTTPTIDSKRLNYHPAKISNQGNNGISFRQMVLWVYGELKQDAEMNLLAVLSKAESQDLNDIFQVLCGIILLKNKKQFFSSNAHLNFIKKSIAQYDSHSKITNNNVFNKFPIPFECNLPNMICYTLFKNNKVCVPVSKYPTKLKRNLIQY